MTVKLKISLIALSLLSFLSWPQSTQAVVNPEAFANNKFGIHLIDNTTDEASEAASLVNSTGGDWGYVTVIIQDNDRKHDKWQTFFNELRRRHLIPIVRLATSPQGNNWQVPYDKEEQAWADFLDNLIWPVKNRYVVIYNEPNQGQEWAGQVDPVGYAHVLSQTIDALKSKNPDFFVLNAGFDASAPQQPPSFEDEKVFLTAMNQAVPGIFNKLDGWSAHAYPNPGYIGSPSNTGRISVQGYNWELNVLKGLGVSRNLPVFITETGWKHAEGLIYDSNLPTSDTIGDYFKTAFTSVWTDPKVVAVTPFLLNYQQVPFDHFSFKKVPPSIVIAPPAPSPSPDSGYYSQYQKLLNLTKSSGQPTQDRGANLVEGSIYTSLTIGQHYTVPLVFLNMGQSIWGETGPIQLSPIVSSGNIDVPKITLPPTTRIEPGQRYVFNVSLYARQTGLSTINFSLSDGSGAIPTQEPTFTAEVKSPVILTISAHLNGKTDVSGSYSLRATSVQGTQIRQVDLNRVGQSDLVETPELLPDYMVTFTLTKPFYLSKSINVTVQSGNNLIDFGVLQPDILATILHPSALWDLLTHK